MSRYYFNVYIQNFPGEHAQTPPQLGMRDPPPKINLWTRSCHKGEKRKLGRGNHLTILATKTCTYYM